MQFASRIWRVLAGDRHLMVASVGFGLLFTALGIIPPLLIRKMILWLRKPDPDDAFWVLACFVAVVYIVRGAMRYLYGLSSHIAAYRALHRLSLNVYRHLQKMSPSYLNRHHSGNLVARTIGDVEAIEDYIAHGIPESMLAIVIPLTMSVVLFLINPQLALIALAIFATDALRPANAGILGGRYMGVGSAPSVWIVDTETGAAVLCWRDENCIRQ